jgi:phosphoserine aminotransferase
MKHNFSAGPCILPAEVMEKASQAIVDYNSTGLSLIEISHRSRDFIQIMDKAVNLSISLLGLEGKGYKALFLQGGASLQFISVAYNLLSKKSGYCNTGTWSKKALNEARILGEVTEVCSSEDKNFNYIPKSYQIPDDLDYLHITTNNTIFGTQYKNLPDCNTLLVADCSSDIFSRDIDYSKFDLLYAGAQKNMGPAGTTLVVVKEEILGRVKRKIPSMLDYRVHIDKDSMFNTPPVFAVYTSLLNLQWLSSNGGIKSIEKINKVKAQTIYGEIDSNPLFF